MASYDAEEEVHVRKAHMVSRSGRMDGPIRRGIDTNLILHDDMVTGKAEVQYKRFKYT